MNNRGQQLGLGIIILAFVVVITGLALFTPVAQLIGDASNPVTSNNDTNVTITGGTTVDLPGQELFTATGSVVMYNVTTATTAATLVEGAARGNFTFSEGVSTTTGVKTVQITSANNSYTGVFQLEYSYGQDGFIENAGARSVAGLIVIFMALAIMMVMLIPALRSGVADMLKG